VKEFYLLLYSIAHKTISLSPLKFWLQQSTSFIHLFISLSCLK